MAKATKQISLAKKLIIAFSFLFLISILTGILFLRSLTIQRNTAAEVSEIWLPSVNKASEINLNIAKLRIAELDFVSQSDTDTRATLKASFDEYQQNLFIYRKVFEPLIHTPEQQKIYDQFSETWDKYTAVHDQMVAAVDKNKMDEAGSFMNQSNEIYEVISKQLTELSNKSFFSAIDSGERRICAPVCL